MELACDGGCPNNGRSNVVKWRVYDLDKKKLVVDRVYEFPEDSEYKATNNLAELFALVAALKIAEPNSKIFTDSQVVLTWLDNMQRMGRLSKNDSKAQYKIFEGVRIAIGLIDKKNIKVYKWRKDLFGETPADCK